MIENMNKTQSLTAIASYLQVVGKVLQSKGVDPKPIFSKANIDYVIKNSPQNRIDYHKISTLWQLAAEASNEPLIGLHASNFMHPTHLHAFGTSLLTSENLYEFLQRFQRFNRFIANTADFSVEDDGEYVLFKSVLLADVCVPAQDCFWSFILRFMRHLLYKEFNPVSVKLIRPKPTKHEQLIAKFYLCPITYGQDVIEYKFKKHDLLVPLMTASKELAQVNDQVMIDYLAKVELDDIRSRVESKLFVGVKEFKFSKQDIANSLNMSQRTMQQKLHNAGTSFQEVVDDFRFELAKGYLQKDSLLASQVAYLVGFKDMSSFSRAFKRWSGMSPTQYKLNYLSP